MLARLPFSGAIHRGWRAAVGGFTLPCPGSAVQWLKTAPDGVWLPDSVGTGTARTPQQGRCYTLNGTNEYVSHPDIVLTGDFTISTWVYRDGDTSFMLWGGDRLGGMLSGGKGYLRWENGAYYWILKDDTETTMTTFGASNSDTLPDQTWTNLVVRRSGTSLKMFWNGVEQFSKTDATAGGTLTLESLGRAYNSNTYCLNGRLADHRVYSRALTDAEILYIGTLGSDGSEPVLTNCELWLKCDEQAGSTAYNSNGSGEHGTITSAALSTFHGSTQNIYSRQNQVGYSDGGSGVFIPRDESDPTNDVLGNPLDYTGRVPLPAKIIQSHCLTFDGVADYVNFENTLTAVKTIAFRVKLNSVTSHTDYLFQGASGKYVLIQNGSIVLVGFTGTNAGYVDGVEVVGAIGSTGWHTIVLTNTTGHDFDAFQFGRVSGLGYADVSVCDIRLSTSVWSEEDSAAYHAEAGEDSTLTFDKQYPCAEGASAILYEVVAGNFGGSTTGTIVGTPAALWAERQDLFAYNANQGFRLNTVVSPAQYVPAMLDGLTSSVNLAITNPAVACWNHSESHIDFDPYNTPELTAFSNDYDPDVDDLALDGSQWVRRLSATQWNDFASYSAPLTSSCLTSATRKFSIPTHLNSLILEHYPLQETEDADPGLQFAPALGSYYLVDINEPNLLSTTTGKNGNAMYVADDGGTYSAAGTIAIGSDAAWNTDNAHTFAVWVNLSVKTSATDLLLLDIQNGGGAGNYWKIFYDQSADRFAVTDGTTTLTDTVSPGAGQWFLLVLAVDLAGNANFYVVPAGGDVSTMRKQSTSGWYVTTQDIATINVCHTLAENEETAIDELLVFGDGTRRLFDNEILHLAREQYATAGVFSTAVDFAFYLVDGVGDYLVDDSGDRLIEG